MLRESQFQASRASSAQKPWVGGLFVPKNYQWLHFLFSGSVIWWTAFWVICRWNEIEETKQCVKEGFFQKVMAKSSNLSNRHSCEPKIVSYLLYPVHVGDKILVLVWNHIVKNLLILDNNQKIYTKFLSFDVLKTFKI